MNNYTSLKRQQGVVIVVALFFVAIVVTIAYFMMSRLERDTYRTRLLLRDTQAELYAQGSIAWAVEQLRDNVVNKKPNKPVDVIPIKSPVNEVNGYKVTSIIQDMQARMNVNNLTTDEAKADFKRLLQLIDPSMSEEKAKTLILAIADWITPGQPHNEYEKYYMDLAPPYRAAHRPMASVSELRLIKGMTPALFNALQPYVTALPTSTAINVQTAPAPVLAALSPKMTVATGKAIEKARAQTTIPTTQAFLNLDMVKNHEIPPGKIIAISTYFLVETTVTIEKQQVVLYTLLERNGSDNKSEIHIVWQSKSVPG